MADFLPTLKIFLYSKLFFLRLSWIVSTPRPPMKTKYTIIGKPSHFQQKKEVFSAFGHRNKLKYTSQDWRKINAKNEESVFTVFIHPWHFVAIFSNHDTNVHNRFSKKCQKKKCRKKNSGKMRKKFLLGFVVFFWHEPFPPDPPP